MMKMSRRGASCLITLLLAVTSVSAATRKPTKITSLKELQKIDFDQSVPKHSLMLLHWFANTVNIDNNNIISLTFEPNSEFGSHRYHNSERLLDALPRGQFYYTVGNIRQDTSRQLPNYVSYPPTEYEGQNSDRIIFCVQGRRIHQVYITQHYGRSYDPDHTYQITANLLRQIREFSVREGQRPLYHLRNRYDSSADVVQIIDTWGASLACLGLFLFIVLEEKHFSNRRNNRPNNNRQHNNRPDNNRQHNNRPDNNRQHNNRPENNRRENSNVRQINNAQPINNRQNKCSYGTKALIWCCAIFVVLVIGIYIVIKVFLKK